MRYMMFIKHREDFDISKVPQSLFGAMDKFISDSAKDGVFIDGAGLQPSKAGHKVRLAKGKITTIDGPFAEAKEIVGGYSIMQAESVADLGKVLVDHPHFMMPGGTIEVLEAFNIM